MTTKVRDALTASAGTGEVLTIVYDGGSQPGSKREIIVDRLDRKGVKVQAVDLQTHSSKTFFVDRITIVSSDHPAPAYDANVYRASRAPGARRSSKVEQRTGFGTWLRGLFGR